MSDSQGNSTRAIHAGVKRRKPAPHSITTPIVQSATFTFEDTADLVGFMHHKVWGGGEGLEREEYGRYGNPTLLAVERKIAALEGAEDALLFASGMAAITTILLASLPTGAHIVMTNDCYRRTRQFCESFLGRLGIETTLVPVGDYSAMEAALRPTTRFIISESPTNPYLRLADFERVADLGRRYKIRTLVDSTFGTPINQRPYMKGIDFVMHSGTKYLGGHHDLLAGVVVGSYERISALRAAQGVLGNVLSPYNAFLLERGLRTLSLRMSRHNENGLAVARYLESHPKIRRVWYPGLPSHPDYDLACRQMAGFGGVVSFEVEADLETTGRFIDALTLPYIAPSLGGVESLIEQPALMSFYEKAPEERAELGISDSLVRFAVGIEDSADLIADLEQALATI
jgi:cystathionine gamma-synthase